VIDDYDQRSTICEKDGFSGLRAWDRTSVMEYGFVVMSIKADLLSDGVSRS